MTVQELKEALEPFMDGTVALVRQGGGDYFPIVGITYMHDEEGHIVFQIPPASEHP